MIQGKHNQYYEEMKFRAGGKAQSVKFLFCFAGMRIQFSSPAPTQMFGMVVHAGNLALGRHGQVDPGHLLQKVLLSW